MRRSLLLGGALLMAVSITSSFTTAGAQASGSLAGGSDTVTTVYVANDLDENGIWDEGEPGLEGWGVSVKCGDVIFDSGMTEADGKLTFDQGQPRGCLDLHDQFGWLTTTLEPIDIAEDRDGVVFLVRHVGDDVELFSGLLIVDGLPAEPGPTVDALVAGQSCGEVLLYERPSFRRYELYVVSSEERPGCAAPGSEVAFMLDGRPAGTAEFEPLRRVQQDLIAGDIPMYFSFSFSSPNVAGEVTPTVRSNDCGDAFVDDFGFLPPNSQTVFVRAEGSQTGCGGPGLVVTLRIGQEVLSQVMWEPGRVDQFSLRQFGDADCDGDVNSVDAAVVLQHSAGLLASLECARAADVNNSGQADALDAALLLQHDAGLLRSFPPE